MNPEEKIKPTRLTRRDFARTAAIAATAAAIAPAATAAKIEAGNIATSPTLRPTTADDAATARQAEIDNRASEVIRRYGDRLSAEQKTEIRRLSGEMQKGLDRLRAYPLGNGDQPATVLRVVPDPSEVRRAPRR